MNKPRTINSGADRAEKFDGDAFSKARTLRFKKCTLLAQAARRARRDVPAPLPGAHIDLREKSRKRQNALAGARRRCSRPREARG
jgi:hypothetical protein